jgi:hypothetical protein
MSVQRPVHRERRVRARSGPGGARRQRPDQKVLFSPASWLFAAVAIILIGVLTYYLTLTTRPEISQITPAPNSTLAPGLVTFDVSVNSQRTIETANLLIDGEPVEAMIEETSDGRWRIHYQQVLERGQRGVTLEVVDSSGRSAEHSWSINAAGDLIQPRIALISPPANAILAPGTNGVTIQVTTFGDLDRIELTFDGEPIAGDVTDLEPGDEYPDDNEIPVFDWKIRAETRLSAGTVQLDARVVDEHGAEALKSWNLLVAGSPTGANARYFPRTGEYTVEPFLSFWDENNGAATIGPPVGPPIATDDGDSHQYFRYARLERDDDGQVYLGLIGREIFGQPENPPDRPPGSNARLFDTTGHYIRGPIREFWEENGGLVSFGYPLSQEFETDQGYAQYFERALIEVIVLGNLEIVELAPLGEQLYASRVIQSLAQPSDLQ